MKDNKKIIIMIIVIIGLLVLVIGVSYAYWKSITSQESSNVIESSCLKLEIHDNTDAINLSSAYPMSEGEASKLTPYEFEVSNTCNTDAEFAINLDILDVADRLNSNYVAISFNNNAKEILGTKTKVNPIYKGEDYTAIEAYNLGNDELKVGESKTYTLKLWLDSTVESTESMNKQFLSKISLSTETIEYAVKYIKNLVKTSNEIVSTNAPKYNLRYIGKDPSNYVLFNGELWRIIGVMNDVEDEAGTIEPRVKIIRNESIGEYSWDNNGVGINNWSSVTTIREVLNNGAYYNRTIGTCPSGRDKATTECDFSNTGLTNEAKGMINKVKWKLGGRTTDSTVQTADAFYKSERGTDVCCGRPTEWTGEVGLMYPSDYGYATSGGETTERYVCLDTNILDTDITDWGLSTLSDCKNNDWLYTESGQWTMTSKSTDSMNAFGVIRMGSVSSFYPYVKLAIRPVVYLSTSTKIQSGTGSSTDPYILGM